MIVLAYLIDAENVSQAWLNAVGYLLAQDGHESTNLMVQIKNPLSTEQQPSDLYESFCTNNDLTCLRKVADTIFPRTAYEIVGCDKGKLHAKYQKIHKAVKGNWGSYFQQLTGWRETGGAVKNQLYDIINLINSRQKVHKKAYVMHIPNPLKHGNYVRGGPCLQSLYLQLESSPRVANLLSVYRSHDFGVKAYGNYIGLGNLLSFIASETNFDVGSITCVSSSAFIRQDHAGGLKQILDVINNGTR